MIHQTAIIDPSAKIASGVEIGPWCWIGADVEIGEGCVIGSHVVVKGPTKIGANNKIFQFASIGEECQDKKYKGEPTRLEIGDNNVIRESVTIHRGTVQDNSLTRIGSGNLLMAYVHVAHDCIVGNNNILANNATLAGHVQVGDFSILGGFTGVHQFCKIGSFSFCGVGSVVVKDVIPYLMAAGQNAVPHGMNTEGLKRKGYTADSISALKKAYKIIYRNGLTLADAKIQLAELAKQEKAVQLIVDFLNNSDRGIIR
ncbi:acyl-ACP--UDP-N-acetylglucosamine O-acyltransferase [Catenovulum sediminis]|uniref:Acyl-[acyl-carrier-protein]--UDP-N-acetylglucosamine O-acyltransferase n=1 Tax=Catenovulum sediminis TaxID=1740262 RepID=A0ABV1RJ85_9ALTE|nr:acyl-ACP--UDP-N-acetylglucosamine O-acyltransferase [Catenovulum sediminis]